MKKILFLLFACSSYLSSEECITYKNMISTQLDGQLLEVKGTRYWDHGEEIRYYIFRLDKEMCFDDGDGPINTNEIQVILNKKQHMNLEELLSKKVKIQIEDFLWGGTQQWKRSIGVPKARFILNPS